MPKQVFGELRPVGGGDPIPLTQTVVTVGRRDSCDISLKFANVSGLHCELTFTNGFWQARDLKSANGTKVKGDRIAPNVPKAIQPGDEVAFANHRFTIQYVVSDQSAISEAIAAGENVFGQSLMEKAGLTKAKPTPKPNSKD